MNKVEWYLSGYEAFGWRVRVAVWFIKLFYKLRLISEEDAKRFANQIITAWFIYQARKKGLRVSFVKLGER